MKETYQEASEKYNKLMMTASKLRLKSLGNPEARDKYNKLLESRKFLELEDYLLSTYATNK